eukprot:1449301-Pleurochrysis_carterae.AAC.1
MQLAASVRIDIGSFRELEGRPTRKFTKVTTSTPISLAGYNVCVNIATACSKLLRDLDFIRKRTAHHVSEMPGKASSRGRDAVQAAATAARAAAAAIAAENIAPPRVQETDTAVDEETV